MGSSLEIFPQFTSEETALGKKKLPDVPIFGNDQQVSFLTAEENAALERISDNIKKEPSVKKKKVGILY